MGNNKTAPKTGMVLQVEATDIFSDCFSVDLAWVSITTGSMKRYLGPTEVARAVQLLQDGASIHAIARRFLFLSPRTVSKTRRRFQESGSHSGAGQGCKRSLNHPQDWYLFLCAYKMAYSRPLV